MKINKNKTARELTAHRVNGVNEMLRIFVLDQPGQGGACHEYAILMPMDNYEVHSVEKDLSGYSTIKWDAVYGIGKQKYNDKGDVCDHATLTICEDKNIARVSYLACSGPDDFEEIDFDLYDIVTHLPFQNGPLMENGINGITQEALLAVLIDRLEGFQSGQFKCHDNQMALDSIQSARLWLHKRTLDRLARSVEGTNQL